MKRLIFIIGLSGLFLNAFASDANTIIENNGCMECHNIRGIKEAPAFMGIARMNLRRHNYQTAKEIIMNSIKNGSKGKYQRFSQSQMPPYSNLNNDELESLADYILSLNSQRGKGSGRGMGRGKGMMR